jgi:hypothetical protein
MGLDGDGLRLFGWCFQNRRWASPFIFPKMSDILSDKSLGRHMQPHKTSTRSACEGESDPTNLLGGPSAKKWGRSHPIGPFLRGDFRRGGSCKRLRTSSVGRASGEEVGSDEGAERNSYLLHLGHLLPLPVSSRIRRRRRAKHRKESRGLERPQASVWARNRVQKWGRSSPFRCFARVQKDRRAMRNLLLLEYLLDSLR